MEFRATPVSDKAIENPTWNIWSFLKSWGDPQVTIIHDDSKWFRGNHMFWKAPYNLVGGFNPPLWKRWYSHLGLWPWQWHSQLNGKSFKIPWFQSPPSSNSTHDGSMVLLYFFFLVLHGSHQYTPVMLALIYQHHGSVMGYKSCIIPVDDSHHPLTNMWTMLNILQCSGKSYPETMVFAIKYRGVL